MSEGGFASRGGGHAHGRAAAHDVAAGADPYAPAQVRLDLEPAVAAVDAELGALQPALDVAERCERRCDYDRAKAVARDGIDRARRALRGAEQLVRRTPALAGEVAAARERLDAVTARADELVARRDDAIARWLREHPAIARGARAVFSDRMPDVAPPREEHPPGRLPHLDAIQASFGRHDVTAVAATVGGAAATEADALGATAFTRGGEASFAGAPDLHTAAHEAAHAVQQRAGAARRPGLGPIDDALEAHADAVADAVVAGEPAEALLDAAPAQDAERVHVDAPPQTEDRDDDDVERGADDASGGVAPAPAVPVQRKAKAGGLPVAPPDARLTPQPSKLSLRGRIGEASAPQAAALVNQTAHPLVVRGVLHEPAADTHGQLGDFRAEVPPGEVPPGVAFAAQVVFAPVQARHDGARGSLHKERLHVIGEGGVVLASLKLVGRARPMTAEAREELRVDALRDRARAGDVAAPASCVRCSSPRSERWRPSTI